MDHETDHETSRDQGHVPGRTSSGALGREPPDDADDAVLRDILGALMMPRSGLRAWFGQLQRFCDRHGGARHYADLLRLIARCQEQLDRMDAGDLAGPGGDRAQRRSDPARR